MAEGNTNEEKKDDKAKKSVAFASPELDMSGEDMREDEEEDE